MGRRPKRGVRPEHLVVVAGTATEVGKTWVTAGLARALGAAGRVAVRKPVQSHAPGRGPSDAEILAAVTGEAPTDVCSPPRSYERPIAPPMAAHALGRPGFTVAQLMEELQWPPDARWGLVESVGGVRSPLADDGDTVTLVELLRPDHVVLVADAGLGTINAVRLCVAVLPAAPLVVLNRYDDGDELHQRNAAWLRERDGLAVYTSVVQTAAALTASME